MAEDISIASPEGMLSTPKSQTSKNTTTQILASHNRFICKWLNSLTCVKVFG